jgi:hypothetical protein
LESYHKKYDEKRKVYLDQHDHDRSSHAADSFRYFAVSQKTEPDIIEDFIEVNYDEYL